MYHITVPVLSAARARVNLKPTTVSRSLPRRSSMMYFPGPQPSSQRGSATPADAFAQQQRRPPAANMRNNFSGSQLEREFAGASFDAAALHRDASSGGRRPAPGKSPSPYGVLVPRKSTPSERQQQKPPSSAHAQSGMVRPSQQQQQQQRMRAGGPRARFPQNFPAPRMPAPPRVIGPPRGQEPDFFNASAPLASGQFGASAPSFGGGAQSHGGSSGAEQWGRQPLPARGSPGLERHAGYGGGSSHPPEVMQITQRPDTSGGGEEAAMMAAMAELEQLQGTVGSDARDGWRFEQARRPTTAPGGGNAGPLGYGSGGGPAAAAGGGRAAAAAAAHHGGPARAQHASDELSTVRPGTSAGADETEAELRVRLATAESVMRKLYRKTNDLQERLASDGAQHGAGGSPKKAGAAAGDDGDWSELLRPATAGAAGTASSLPEGSSEREQALYLLQQKEGDLHKMREYTSQLASRLEHLAEEQQRGQARPSTSAGERNSEYRERYMRMRNEYRQLLRSRTDSVRRSGRLAQENEHGVLIEQLDTALRDEAELHRKESQRLNEELYLQEKQSCDWYVEKRLLQDRLQALESEIGQRDQLEGQIDGKMLALFSRLKSLEDANVKLEQDNEKLAAKAGVKVDE